MLLKKQKKSPLNYTRLPVCVFPHEAIVDSSFAVHTCLTVSLHSKHSGKSHPKVYVFTPQQSQWIGVCLPANKHQYAWNSKDSEDFCLPHLDWW